MTLLIIIFLCTSFINNENQQGCDVMENQIISDFLSSFQTKTRNIVPKSYFGEIERLKGNPKTIERFNHSLVWDSKSYEKLFLSKEKRVVKKITRLDEKPVDEYEYVYDNLGNMIKRITKKSSICWSYEDTEYPVRRILGNSITNYYYEANKKVEHRFKNVTDTVEICVSDFDEYRRLLRTDRITMNKELGTKKHIVIDYDYTYQGYDSIYQFSYVRSGDVKKIATRREYHYNDCGMLEKTIETNSGLPKDTTFYNYTLSFNETDLPILSIGNSKFEIKVYTFDHVGNWVKLERYKGDNLIFRSKRIIEYF